MSEELHVTTTEKLRGKINLILPWLGNESQLKKDRPDLYAMWMDYRGRKITKVVTSAFYEQELNLWLMHYFLVHGKK